MFRLLPFLLLSPACSNDDAVFPDNTSDAVATYARIAEASYDDSVTTAVALDAALESLVASPSASTLADARDAWLDSREPYLQTEVYRFYDGPIDNPTDGPEGLINAWPLDEAYIDYVDGIPDAGIVNGTGTIDAATLEGLNEAGGEKNIATGYHAIEFLLWGQDTASDGPGDRPHTDYVTEGPDAAPNADRRAEYLLTVSDLLLTHLEGVHAQWAEHAAWRTNFEADGEAAFEDILTGMIVLSGFETGGERLQAALDSGDQEDEHSCFSDNTHRDMIQDIQGVQNVWLGTYTRTDGTVVSGTGIHDVVARVDADLADRVTTRIAESLSLANALNAPFDQEITPGAEGNARVQALIDSLGLQEAVLTEVFVAFGLAPEIPTE